MRAVLQPAAAFGQAALHDLHRRDGCWEGRTGALHVRATGWGPRAAHAGPRLESVLALAPGRTHDLVVEIGDHPPGGPPPDPEQLWAATEAAWRRTTPQLRDTSPPATPAAPTRSSRGLTSAGGGMVAAATMSLPERAERGRDYDYRYVWIRDQCYAGQAVAADAAHPLLDDAAAFVAARLLADGPHLAPAYTVDGSRVPDQRSTRPARLPRRHRHRRQPRQRPVPARRVRGGAAAVRRRRPPRPPRHRARQGRRRRDRRDRGPPPRARRRDLGARRPPLDALPADLRRRAVRDRRAPARPRRGAAPSHWPTRSSPTPAPSACTPTAAGSAPPTTHGWTPHCCCPRCAAPSRRRIPARRQPCAAVAAELAEDGYLYRFRHDARPLGARRRRVHAVRLLDGVGRPPAGPRDGGAALVRAQPGRVRVARACSPRSSTSPSTSCAATCPRRSCTRCCSRPPYDWPDPTPAGYPRRHCDPDRRHHRRQRGDRPRHRRPVRRPRRQRRTAGPWTRRAGGRGEGRAERGRHPARRSPPTWRTPSRSNARPTGSRPSSARSTCG